MDKMNTNSVSLRLDLRLVCVLLLVVIALMVAIWQPWEGGGEKRVVTVTGEARIEAVPDEYTFSPYFQEQGSNSQALRDKLAKLGDKLVKELKELGVPENKISLSGSSYDYHYYTNDKGEQTAQLRATVTVDNKELAQKVQDYLLKQDIKGQITPQAQFSQTRQDELKRQARDLAVADARSEAERSAGELEAKLGKIVELKDSETVAYPWYGREGVALDSGNRSEKPSLPVTPGEQAFTFQVQATFELK
jgi:uncharacterized protein YggE